MKFIIILIVCLSFTGFVSAQQTALSGVVVDKESGTPVQSVNIFISGTTIGTVSDTEGKFSLQNINGDLVEIVFSHISYQTQISSIKTGPENKENLIQLVPNTLQLEEVTLEVPEDKEWKRNMKRFRTAFLGTSGNASKCEIENPWVIDLSRENGILRARASDLIRINNKALGYRLQFLLTHFTLKGIDVSYSGRYHFEELEAESDAQAARWHKNRAKTYKGSLRHFLSSLLRDQLRSEGFIMHFAKFNSMNNTFDVKNPALMKDIINNTSSNQFFEMDFNGFMQVVYTKGKVKAGRDYESVTGQSLASPRSTSELDEPWIIDSENYQTSYLFLIKTPITLSVDGSTPDREYIKEYGFWAGNRVAELLPLEYIPEGF